MPKKRKAQAQGVTLSTFMSDEVDAVTPTIRHSVEEIWFGERLERQYYFLDYVFARNGVAIRARAYVDQMRRVDLFGATARHDFETKMDAPDLKRDVLAYLSRRFAEVVEH